MNSNHVNRILLLAAGCLAACATTGNSNGGGGSSAENAPTENALPSREMPRLEIESKPVATPAVDEGNGALKISALPPRSQGGSESGRRAANPWEFTLNGAGASDEKFRAGGVQVAGSFGYYFSEMLELSVRQNVSYADAGVGSPELWDGASRVALDFHFPIDRFVPYVGVNGGYIYGDSVHDTLVAGPEAGVKFYVKPDTFLQFGVEYGFTFESSDRIDDAFDNGSFFYELGFGVRF